MPNGFSCNCLEPETTLEWARKGGLGASWATTNRQLHRVLLCESSAETRKELLNQCTRGTDEDNNVGFFRCPACAGCTTCKTARKFNCVSLNELSEQIYMRDLIRFFPGQLGNPGYYESELPLLKDYSDHIENNFDQADMANKKLIESLSKSPDDLISVQESYNDLVKRGFITELVDLPKDEQLHIAANVRVYIPNSVAWKSQSHSTKVRICWDLSRKTGKSPPLNASVDEGCRSLFDD